MKIAVWGAGTLGHGIAFKLMSSIFTTELVWINRDFKRMNAYGIDFKHGLSFAPTCREIYCAKPEHAYDVLPGAKILILAYGIVVKEGQTRQDVYFDNCDMYDKTVIKYIRESGFEGVILVLTNPVDLMCRYLKKAIDLDHRKIIGLGTVVETARLRRALSEALGKKWRASQLWPFAIGTHDENFIPVFPHHLIGPGCTFEKEKEERIKKQIIKEVALSAERVKIASKVDNKPDSRIRIGTMYPIVEGTFQVISSIALDRREVLTVSVYDRDSDYYYSLPAIIGSEGVLQVQSQVIDSMPELKDLLNKSIQNMKNIVNSE